MKVWIVSGGWRYEGMEVMGVFSSEEKARASIERWREKTRSDAFACDFVEMRTGELDGALAETAQLFDKTDGDERSLPCRANQ